MRKKLISRKSQHFAGIIITLILTMTFLLLSGCATTDEPVVMGSGNPNDGVVAVGADNPEGVSPEPISGTATLPLPVEWSPIAVSVGDTELVDSETFYITKDSDPAQPGYDPADYTVEFTIANIGTFDLSDLSTALKSVLEKTIPDFEITEPADTELAAGGTFFNSTTFEVMPVIGLLPGTYTDVVMIDCEDSDANAWEFVFDISFTVAAPAFDAETPRIDSQPQDTTVTTGQAVTLLVAASVTDGGTLSYQWYSNQTNSNTGGPAVGGGTSSTFAAPTGTAGTFYYYAVVTNTNTNATGAQTAAAASNAATVVVNAAPAAPAITTADNTGVVFGIGGSFQVAASGATPVTFSLTGAPSGVTINSSTGLLSIVSTVPAGSYPFMITAGNGISPNATQNFTLTVSRAPVANAGINVTAPAVGNSPVTTATIATGTGQFTIGAVTWDPFTATFASDTRYTASLVLTASENFTFTGGLTGFATINGIAAAVTNNTGTAVTLSFQFPAIPGAGDNNGGTPPERTVPADGGSVMVGFTQDGSAVNLDLNQGTVDELLSNASHDTINIDMTGLPWANESVKPAAALAQIAGAGFALELSLPQGTALFDAPSLTSITQQAGGENIGFLLNQAGMADLTQEQRNALGSDDVIYSIRLASGSQVIRELNGNLTVTLHYGGTLPVAVWYLDSQGVLEKMDSTYDTPTNTVSFTTDHLSFYVVGPDAAAAPPPENGDLTEVTVSQPFSGGTLALLIAIIAVAAAVTVFGIRKIRSKTD